MFGGRRFGDDELGGNLATAVAVDIPATNSREQDVSRAKHPHRELWLLAKRGNCAKQPETHHQA